MSASITIGVLPTEGRRQALLTAAPPVVFGLGIAAGALVMGGPWNTIPTWRLVLGLALMAVPWAVIVVGGVMAAARRLPTWGYTWAGAAVIMLLLGAQTAAEELAEQGTLALSPVVESIAGILLVLANLAVLLLAAVRGSEKAGLVSLAQAAIMGLSLCQAATYAPFNRLDVALLAAPVGLAMGLLMHLYCRGARRDRAAATAILWLINAGLVWLLNSVWRDWLLDHDKTSPAVPLLLLLTALLLAGPILGILVSLGRRQRKRMVALLLLVPAVCGASLAAYSWAQTRALEEHPVYAAPEEGAAALVAQLYSDMERVDIVYANESVFPHLWFVETHVWAAERSDGTPLSARGYDNPGWFFLRLQNGWVFVAEDRLPELVALGCWLFGLSG